MFDKPYKTMGEILTKYGLGNTALLSAKDIPEITGCQLCGHICLEEHLQIIYIMHELEKKAVKDIAMFLKTTEQTIANVLENDVIYQLMKQEEWLPQYMTTGKSAVKESNNNTKTEETKKRRGPLMEKMVKKIKNLIGYFDPHTAQYRGIRTK